MTRLPDSATSFQKWWIMLHDQGRSVFATYIAQRFVEDGENVRTLALGRKMPLS
jgi:hypothetical protein